MASNSYYKKLIYGRRINLRLKGEKKQKLKIGLQRERNNHLTFLMRLTAAS